MFHGFHEKYPAAEQFGTLIITQMFIEHQISMFQWLLEDHVTFDTDFWKISFALTGINHILKYIRTEKSEIIFHNITIILYF